MTDYVRKASERDIGRIAEILVFTKRSSYREIFKNDEVSFNYITVLNVIEEIKQTGIENTYVFDDDITKGMLRFAPDKSEICELYVDSFFQGSGVGSELIEYIEEVAQNKGNKTLNLWVLEKNQKAIDFYLSKDFVRTNERKEFENTKQFLIKFEKTL